MRYPSLHLTWAPWQPYWWPLSLAAGYVMKWMCTAAGSTTQTGGLAIRSDWQTLNLALMLKVLCWLLAGTDLICWKASSLGRACARVCAVTCWDLRQQQQLLCPN